MPIKKDNSFNDMAEKDELPEPFAKALMEIAEMRIATAPLIREYKVLRKPLPQIIDELDDNIRAAAEAGRKALEAAQAAAQAANAATNASMEAEKRAGEARQAGLLASQNTIKAVAKTEAQFKKTTGEISTSNAALLQRIKVLEDRLTKVETTQPDNKIILVRKITKKEAEKEICGLFSKGETLYYSDIAERLNLDLQLVVKICNKLQKSGEIKIDDNALQSR
jgi:hypothetical protein